MGDGATVLNPSPPPPRVRVFSFGPSGILRWFRGKVQDRGLTVGVNTSRGLNDYQYYFAGVPLIITIVEYTPKPCSNY